MLTRCPACQTVFRVTPEQLAARQGRVRCGHCLNAFDAGRHALAETPGADLTAPPTPAATESRPAPEAVAPPPPLCTLEFEVVALEEEEDPPATVAPALEEAAAPQPPDHLASPLGLEPWLPDEWPEETADRREPRATLPAPPEVEEKTEAADGWTFFPLPENRPRQEAAPPIPTDPEHPAGEEPTGSVPDEAPPPQPTMPARLALDEPPPARNGAWSVAGGVLAALLLAQGAMLFRQALSQEIPALRPVFERLCLHLGCAMPLPRDAGAISIEATDLHPEPGSDGRFVLHATVRNRATFLQAHPHLELTLTDNADKVLVRRVFSPEEWLRDTNPTEGFPPGRELNVKLAFSAAGVAAVGYRVYAFYP